MSQIEASKAALEHVERQCNEAQNAVANLDAKRRRLLNDTDFKAQEVAKEKEEEMLRAQLDQH